jgi:hypothetical protein
MFMMALLKAFFNPLDPPFLGDWKRELRDTLRLPAGGFSLYLDYRWF